MSDHAVPADGLQASVTVQRDDFRLDAAIHVPAGDVVAVVGPNGAGKTTLLEALAGDRPVDDGVVALDGRVLDAPGVATFVPSHRRRVGVVTQASTLFPHLGVLDNVAFGPRAQGCKRRDALDLARRWLERVGAAELAGRQPASLSGGEAQRVALARALAAEPRLLLLDEPLSAVDVTGRAALRRLLGDHLATFAGVAIVVTHDPVEAAGLADRLVVLEDGRITHDGPPREVRARPRSPYVADLVSVNLLRGVGRGGHVEVDGGGRLTVADAGTGPVLAVIHPRAVAVHRERPHGSPRNVFAATVTSVDPEEWADRVRVEVAGEVTLVAELTPAAVAELELAPGRQVWASVKATEIATHPA